MQIKRTISISSHKFVFALFACYNSHTMFDKFRQGADMLKMANRLRQIQNQLSQERITIEKDGIRVVVSGDMKIRELEVDGEEQKKVVDVANEALKKAQETSAKKMQEMGGLAELFGK